MSNFEAVYSKINGVGAFVPENIVTNKDLEKIMDTSDEWIVKRTGIKSRHWASKSESTSDLAYKASLEAIENSSIDKDEIDLIIFATLSPDYDFPGAGCFLQNKLNLGTVPALDIKQQCTGFVYGMSLADSMIKTKKYKNILLVGAEIQSKGLNKTTEGRDISVLFGDGAGAVILSATNESKYSLFDFDLHADGKYTDELCIKAPGTGLDSDERMGQALIDKKLHFPQMNGKVVFVHALKKMTESLTDLLKANNMEVKDVDLFLFHQANLRINSKVGEMLSIPEDKVFNTIEKYGNTTAATIPIGMRDAISAGVLKPGMTVAMCAFGAGFTWGSVVFKY